jgi:UDPglucose 6-dehydrogenase
MSERVAVIGAGHVGLVTAALLASWGYDTVVVESDPKRAAALRKRETPFFEPGLDALVQETLERGSLRLVESVDRAVDRTIGVVCVGTPAGDHSAPDLRDLFTAVDQLTAALPDGAVVVVKSTVPPGTTQRLASRLAATRPGLKIVSCPEFLREGAALEDMRMPHRIVVGGDDQGARERVAVLFQPGGAPVFHTSATSAELIKYGANAFLATKISFINELAHLCDLIGADVNEVAAGVGADPRIGRAFLNAGLGFGGSCFPKDVAALEETGAIHGYTSWMLKACTEINSQQRHRFVAKIKAAVGGSLDGKRIGVLGLAFKAGTDDLRQSPALDIVRSLAAEGAEVIATDPVAVPKARAVLSNVRLVADAYACAAGVDAVVLATEWPEYVGLDWSRMRDVMRGRIVLDGRNALDAHHLAELGLTCYGVGRAPVHALEEIGQPV